jgi:hypothetical protein
MQGLIDKRLNLLQSMAGMATRTQVKGFVREAIKSQSK